MTAVTRKTRANAGNGRFPILVLEAARRETADVVVAAIRKRPSPRFSPADFPVHWMGLGQLGKLIRVFKEAGVQKAIMAGQVRHVQIFGLIAAGFQNVAACFRTEGRRTPMRLSGA